MSELRGRMIEEMQLRGLAETTQHTYLKAAIDLARYYRRSPDALTEEEVRRYFLYLVNEKNVAPGTLKTRLYGIKFLYEHTLKRPFPVLKAIRPRRQTKLPVVLSEAQVRRVLALVRKPTPRMALTIIYSCGLRPSEGARLRVADINGERGQVFVRKGKGNKDRYVPLPRRPHELLRDYWRVQRPQPWLFPGRAQAQHLSSDSLWHVFKAALREGGVTKQATTHTLRHCYATHLLERGVQLRVIQEILGHKSPKTTAKYAHLTKKSMDSLRGALDELMTDL